jgi:hypothetical protein
MPYGLGLVDQSNQARLKDANPARRVEGGRKEEVGSEKSEA